MRISGEMEDGVDTLEARRPDVVPGAEIGGFDAGACRTVQQAQIVAALAQMGGDLGTDIAGGAGD